MLQNKTPEKNARGLPMPIVNISKGLHQPGSHFSNNKSLILEKGKVP
jgi:hypothetical protein